MRKKKLGVARLWHEGNSFSPARTGAEEFRRREWVDPPAARAHYAGTATEMGALFQFLDRNPDWLGPGGQGDDSCSHEIATDTRFSRHAQRPSQPAREC